MRGKDRKRWVISIAAMMIEIGLHISAANADFLTIYGGATYNSATDVGYKNPLQPSLSPGGGIGIGIAVKASFPNSNSNYRAVLWNTSGTVIELGNLGVDSNGWTATYALHVNPSDTVVGWAAKYDGAGTSMGTRAARWDSSGVVTQLDTLDSGTVTNSTAYAINSFGTSVGASNMSIGGVFKGERAVRWDASGTAVIELGNLGTNSSGFANSIAQDINDAGTVVGIAGKYDGNNFRGLRAVRWEASGTAATELGNLGVDGVGSTDSSVRALNAMGTAVGYALKFDTGIVKGARAVRWDASGTVATELGNLGLNSAGSTDNTARAINDSGTATGYARKYVGGIDKGQRAVRWGGAGTAATELGVLGLESIGAIVARSDAFAINESGTAVGYSTNYVNPNPNFSEERAVMWVDTAPIDLNSLIDPSSGWKLTRAYDISDDSWITGIGEFDPDGAGSDPSYTRLFLLHVPEPSAISSLLILMMAGRVRRRIHTSKI